MSVGEKITEFLKDLPGECTLIAVSKTKPNSDIIDAYDSGQRDFGENKVQELTRKHSELPTDIRWHMIGHLQRNKVKYLVDFVYLIHGVDSVRLLKEINKQSQKVGKTTNCLLQVFIADEQTKFGFSKEEILDLMDSQELKDMKNVQIKGLMGMATNTDDQDQIRKEFQTLRKLFDTLKSNQTPNVSMETLSMGMSGDFQLAIEEGSNMIRIGSLLFGERVYS